MKNKLFLLGNGFDLAHNLPTKFDPNFKDIAQKYEQDAISGLQQTVLRSKTDAMRNDRTLNLKMYLISRLLLKSA